MLVYISKCCLVRCSRSNWQDHWRVYKEDCTENYDLSKYTTWLESNRKPLGCSKCIIQFLWNGVVSGRILSLLYLVTQLPASDLSRYIDLFCLQSHKTLLTKAVILRHRTWWGVSVCPCVTSLYFVYMAWILQLRVLVPVFLRAVENLSSYIQLLFWGVCCTCEGITAGK